VLDAAFGRGLARYFDDIDAQGHDADYCGCPFSMALARQLLGEVDG